LEYFSEEIKNAKLPEDSIYEYFRKNNKNYPDDIAITIPDEALNAPEISADSLGELMEEDAEASTEN